MASSGGRQLPPVTYKNCLQSVQILIWYLKCSLFINTVELGNNELFGQTKICSLMQNVPFAYEVNWHLVTGNGSLIFANLFLIKQFLIAKFDCTYFSPRGIGSILS